MDIINYIPCGRQNAVTRECLSKLTGYDDRKNRALISQARREHTIITVPGHRGYYRPTKKDEVERFIRQEESRLKSIGWSLYGARHDPLL